MPHALLYWTLSVLCRSRNSSDQMRYPIDEQYPAVYRDAHGEAATVLHKDGEHLRMTVRGVTFAGTMLDDFEPLGGSDPAALSTFTLDIGEYYYYGGGNYTRLCGCEIEYEAPVTMVTGAGEIASALLRVHLILGVPTERGLDREVLILTLEYGGQTYRSSGRHGDFEGELHEIKAQLPSGDYLKMCINCAFSDYSPAGHGEFASLACFRDNKTEYLKVSDKDGIFHVWDTMTESVQETYLCPEFARRVPGTGYRG